MSNNYKVISNKIISNIQAKSCIEEKLKNQELTYREDKVNQYLKENTKISLKDFEKLKEEILNLEIPRLDEESIIKIIDVMPKTGTELRAIVTHSGIVLVDENTTKILDVLKKFTKN